ncbi:MAG: CoB-CoM heterodisulfide reductase HdrA2 [Promethearchaeota archaeon]
MALFLCHCGTNIAGTIDLEEVKRAFSGREGVVVVDDRYLCSDAGLKVFEETLASEGVERVVVASCTPKLHGELFQAAAEKCGVNRFLVSFANVREQNSWVHHDEPKAATLKAIAQIEMALAQARLASALEPIRQPVKEAALVVGGGVAGIACALAVARAGYPVTLVEREPSIGGMMALFDKTFPTLDCSICILGPLMVAVKDHPLVTLMTNSEVVGVEGHVGNYEVTVRQNPRFVDSSKCVGCFDVCADACPVSIKDPFFPRKAISVPFPQAVPLVPVISTEACVGCRACEVACDRDAVDFNQEPVEKIENVGAIVVATGAKTFDPALLGEYGYEKYPDVVTSLEFERMLSPDGPTGGRIVRPSTGQPAKRFAFLLCVGSRNEEIGREWCSRVCCMAAIKQAFLIKDRVPDAEVFVNFTDVRAFGKGCEEFYNRTRAEKHVRFNRCQVSEVRRDDDTGMLEFVGENTLSGELLEEKVDLVVLAVGLEPAEGTAELASLLNVATGPDGFFLESHLKLRQTEASVRGVYLAGCCQGPKDIPDSVAQAESAAAKVVALLAGGEIELDPRKARVDPKKCDGCRVCEQVCDFGAVKVVDKLARVNVAACTGCGACASACHSGALSIPGFTKDQINAQIDAALAKKTQDPTILAFLCNWCSYAGADLAGTSKIQYPPNLRVVHLMCTAMVDPEYVFRAFARGADGVLVAGCYPQDCHYATGFEKASTRGRVVRELLEDLGIDQGRFVVESVSAGEGGKFARVVREFVERLSVLGREA